jgi:hypothetical protein
MPQRNSSRRIVLRLVLFTLAGWLLWALGRNGERPEAVAATRDREVEATRTRAKTSRFSRRRLATTFAFTTLFFAGAAFSAGAGDLVVGALEGSDSCAAVTSSDEAAASDQTCEAAPAEEQSTETDATEGGSSDEATDPAPEPAPNGDGQSDEAGGDGAGTPAGDDQSTGEDQSAGDQPAGDQGGGGEGAADPGQPTPNPILDGPTGDGSGGADQSDEPDAGPGSPSHAGDDPSSGADNTVGPTIAEDAAPDLEFDGADSGVVWLYRTLPDPTPPAARMNARFARLLARTARANHVDWALDLGVVRVTGHSGSWPATARQLRSVSSRLHALRANSFEWRAVLALSGRTSFADKAVAVANYNRAVGLRALVRGLRAETSALERRVLSNPHLSIYPGGRDDVAHHRINVRVLVLMLYLAKTYGSATISSLDSGHRLYARPGVISAHKYGLAVDIAALGGTPILGHQEAGGITEKAVRSILLLPVELRPKQVISLLGLGGPSFPLANHYDHIHVGY